MKYPMENPTEHFMEHPKDRHPQTQAGMQPCNNTEEAASAYAPKERSQHTKHVQLFTAQFSVSGHAHSSCLSHKQVIFVDSTNVGILHRGFGMCLQDWRLLQKCKPTYGAASVRHDKNVEDLQYKNIYMWNKS